MQQLMGARLVSHNGRDLPSLLQLTAKSDGCEVQLRVGVREGRPPVACVEALSVRVDDGQSVSSSLLRAIDVDHLAQVAMDLAASMPDVGRHLVLGDEADRAAISLGSAGDLPRVVRREVLTDEMLGDFVRRYEMTAGKSPARAEALGVSVDTMFRRLRIAEQRGLWVRSTNRGRPRKQKEEKAK